MAFVMWVQGLTGGHGDSVVLVASSMLSGERKERFHDGALDLRRWHPSDRPGLFLSALHQGGGDVVAVACGSLVGRSRRHLVSTVIEDAPEEQRLGVYTRE